MADIRFNAQRNTFGYEGSFNFPPKFWVLVVLAGVGSGVAGGMLMGLLRAVVHLAWSSNGGDFLSATEKSTALRRFTVVLAAGVLVAIARRVFRRHTGGHAGEVSEAIWFRSGEMPFWHTVGRAVESIVVVGLGAAVGRESAPKQTGAAISYLLARWGKISSSQRRVLVAAGTGAGMAAVYNVPLGGALFALEVLLGELSLTLVLPALATSLIAVAVSWWFLPNVPTCFVPDYKFSPVALEGAGLLGVLAGLASVLYVRAIAWADTVKPRRKWFYLTPILVFAALGLASTIYPQLLGNGQDVVQLTFVDRISLPLLAILLLPRALATIGCLGAGTPGGLFTPTLTVGALLGALFGHLWNQVFPGEDAATYAVFGAGAVLAASSKGPISAIVLMLELTHHISDLALPLILAVAVATLIAKRYDPRSIYSARIHTGKALAAELKEPQVVSAAMPYPEVLKRLLSLPGKPLYVVDENGELIGQIPPDRVVQPESLDGPLEATSADDLAIPMPEMPHAGTRHNALAQLKALLR